MKYVLLFSFAFLIGCSGGEQENKCSSVQEQLIRVNQIRAEGRYCGDQYFLPAKPLELNSTLSLTANKHSNDMASSAFVSHFGSDGSKVSERAKQLGYSKPVGENVSGGTIDLEDTFESFVKSEGHCKNLMHSNYNYFGASCSLGKEPYKIYWVNVFGY